MIAYNGLVLLLSVLVHQSCYGQEMDLLLTLSPLPLNGDREYAAVPNETFTVFCTAMSNDPNVFVLWQRTDGGISSLIIDDGTNATNITAILGSTNSEGNVSSSATPIDISASGSGSGIATSSSGSGSASGITPFGESASGDGSASSGGSASGSGSGDEQYMYTVSVLLQISALDGGVQCSEAGQYECIAGISPQVDIISVNVTVAVAGICCGEEISSGGNTYIWLETPSSDTAIFPCPNNTNFNVSRVCNSEGKWQDFDRNGCGVLADHLSTLIKTTENLTSETISEHIATLSDVIEQSQENEVDQHENNLNAIANIMSSITNQITELNVTIDKSVVTDVVKTVDSLLQWTPTVLAVEVHSSSRIVRSFEDIVSRYSQEIPEDTTQTLNFTSLTLVAEKANLDNLKTAGRRFSAVGGKFVTTEGNIGTNTVEEDAVIDLPASLFQRLGDRTSVGMFFGLYETASLFPVEETNSTLRNTEVYSRVLAATIGQNVPIQNLEEPVTITLKSLDKEGKFIDPSSKKCVSWDFDIQSWTPQGCNTSIGQDGVIVCHCNHLTNFAVLVEVCLREEDCPTPSVKEQLGGLNNSFSNLTSENVEGAVSSLSTVIEQSESNEAEQSKAVLGTVADYFNQIANYVTRPDVAITDTVVNNVAHVVSSLLQWNPQNVVVEKSSRVVQSFEVILSTSAQQAPLNEVQNLTVPSLTILTERRSVLNLTKQGRGFSIGDDIADTILGSRDHVTSGDLLSQHNAAIILPRSLFGSIDKVSSIGTVFGLYDNTNLFPVGGRNNDTDADATTLTQTGSQILSATVGNDSIELENLVEPVSVTLRLNINDTEFVIPGSESCVTWDFQRQDWTTRGCTTEISHDRQFAICTCNHLTNFCVLVDIGLREGDYEKSKVDSALTYISYIGMPISIASLVLTLVTLIIFKNVRQKDVSKFHIQLCLALLLMLIVSLVFVVLSAENESITTLYGGCIFVSILVHYFALTSVVWMGAEALLMFQKLVIVFIQTTTKYIIILSIICWSVPAVPIAISLIAELANGHEVEADIITRRDNHTEKPIFCFLSHPGAFWGAFLAPLLAIIVFNAVIFVCVIVVLIKHVRKTAALKLQSVSKNEVVRLIFSIGGVMFLFGLTWLFAILTFSVEGLRETFQILFTIFNSFQGLFIFVFLCLMSSDVREEWKRFFKIKAQTSRPMKQQFDKKPNPNYTTTTGTLGDSSCKSPTSPTSTSDSIPWKSKAMEKGRESVTISIPFDDEKGYNDDVFKDDEKKEETNEPNGTQLEPKEESAKEEENAPFKPKEKAVKNEPIAQPEEAVKKEPNTQPEPTEELAVNEESNKSA